MSHPVAFVRQLLAAVMLLALPLLTPAQHRAGLERLDPIGAANFGVGDGIVFDAHRPLRLHAVTVTLTGPFAMPVTFDIEVRDAGGALVTAQTINTFVGRPTIVFEPALDIPVGLGQRLIVGSGTGTFLGAPGGVNHATLGIPGLLTLRGAAQGVPDAYPCFYAWVVSGQADAQRWELNQPEARLTADVRSGLVFNRFVELTDAQAATTSRMLIPTGWNARLNEGGTVSELSLGSILRGQGFDLALTAGAARPGGGGAAVTAAGQLVHLDLLAPTFTYVFGSGASPGFPPVGPSSSPLRLPFHRVDTTLGGAVQMIVIDPASLDGFTLSQSIEASFESCPLSEDFDQGSPFVLVALQLAGWSGIDTNGLVAWRFSDLQTSSQLGLAPLPAFSGARYALCRPFLASRRTYQLLSCPIEVSRLQRNEVSFALARPGAGVGTLRVWQVDSPGLARTLLGTWTGPDPAGSTANPVWSVETLALSPGGTSVGILFEYEQDGSADGEIAIDSVVFR